MHKLLAVVAKSDQVSWIGRVSLAVASREHAMVVMENLTALADASEPKMRRLRLSKR
jgi:hypothetical protein